MTPPRSIMDMAFAQRWIARPLYRRIAFGIVAIILALLVVFPREYRAASSIAPSDPNSLGLSGALSQLGAINTVYGSQAATEITLRVARSQSTRSVIIDQLKLIERLHLPDRRAADRWLASRVEVRAMRGSIIQAEIKLGDPQLALDVIAAETAAIRAQLGRIGRNQTGYKREILVKLIDLARRRWLQAQGEYDAFRRRTRYSAPFNSIEAIGERIPTLEAQLRAREIELRTARSFATDQNIAVRQVQAQIDALRAQLAEARTLDANNPNSVNRVVVESTEVQNLEREVTISRSLYDNYRRLLEGTEVEDLTSSSAVRILEPPYVDYSRPIHMVPVALLVLVLMVAAGTEIYVARPPIGTPLRRDEA